MRSSSVRRNAAALLLALGIGVAGLPSMVPAASASEIKYVVNNVPVTSYDIARRAAFLKLQRSSGSASEAMIEQTLQIMEMRRLNVRISDKAVDESYARFAAGNKLTAAQLDQILAQSGVTKEHFKEYIRVQMGWNQALASRYRSQERLSEQDVAHRMLQQGGAKPSATEYMLQHVIFVVPAADKKTAGAKRKREADSMRQRFKTCDTTREFAKGLLDVTVRDLGRVLAPELPRDWEGLIKETKQGAATPVRETDRGFEFIGICSTREVSDDRVAQMVFQNEGSENEKASELSKKYLAELRSKARIVER